MNNTVLVGEGSNVGEVLLINKLKWRVIIMKGKFLNISIFVFSIFCLIITLELLWNIGIYVDAHNTNPSVVYGGEFWNYMNWLRLILTILISIFSLISLANKNKI